MQVEKVQTFVFLACKINCISNINAIKSTFYADMTVHCTWTDPKLIGKKKGEIINYKQRGNGFFDPEIYVTNYRNGKRMLLSAITTIRHSMKGEVERCIHIKGTFMMLSKDWLSFPFDCHNLQVMF